MSRKERIHLVFFYPATRLTELGIKHIGMILKFIDTVSISVVAKGVTTININTFYLDYIV